MDLGYLPLALGVVLAAVILITAHVSARRLRRRKMVGPTVENSPPKDAFLGQLDVSITAGGFRFYREKPAPSVRQKDPEKA